MSIRLRLTLLYSTILALTLIAFGTILYVTQTHLTYDSIKVNLIRQVDALAKGPRRFPDLLPPPPGDGPSMPGLPAGVLPGRWSQTRGLDGTILARTYDLGEANLPLSAKGLKAVQSGLGWFETSQVQDLPLLVYSRRVTTQAGETEIAQVAFPIAEREQFLHTLWLTLVIGCTLAIATAFAIGWVLAGMVLQPIHQITRTAQAIGAEQDFSRRVRHKGPPDEIGQLAVTFNAMLAELESAYRRLEDALTSQRRFVADASHELRTPLTTVRGNVELLGCEPPIDPKERADVLADTTDEVERLIRLVNQLLVLARADAGQLPHREPLPIKPLLEDLHRQARLLAPQTTLDCDCPDDVSVLANRDALKQVLLVLVDNAVVHTPPVTPIQITTTTAADSVMINVRDAGPGIAPDVFPHIFERFYRGQVSRSGKGTGLGLAIARELVEAQGGTLTAASEPDQGSVFTIALPRAVEG